jgi:tRNA(Ile)-lysidine synthase TilS/MesJ
MSEMKKNIRFRSIQIKTNSQTITTDEPENQTLSDVLRFHRLPANLFQGYIVQSGNPIPITLNIQLGDIEKESEIVLHCIRNLDLTLVLPQRGAYEKFGSPVTNINQLVTDNVSCNEKILEIDEHAARSIVHYKVEQFMQEFSAANTVIVGTSGGGDSNTLIGSLKNTSEKGNSKTYICFTLDFDPIFPTTGSARASELCRKYGLEHFIFRSGDIEKMFNMKAGFTDFYNEFNEKFGTNLGEFFGNYIVSLVARHLCKQYQTNEYCLGINREDVVYELLFSLINGYKPLSYPVREIGSIKLLMPLWEIPKKILDSCYPDYSIKNYEERRGSSTFQHNLLSYLAYSIEDIHANFGLSLIKGCHKLFSNQWADLIFDRDYSLYISEYAKPETTEKIKSIISKYFSIPIYR